MNATSKKSLIWAAIIFGALGIGAVIAGYIYCNNALLYTLGGIFIAIAIAIYQKTDTLIDWNALATNHQNDRNDRELIELQRKTIEDLKKQLAKKNQPKWESVINKLLKKGKLQEAIESIDTNITDEEAAKRHIRKAELLIIAYNFPEAEAHYKQAADIFPSSENNFTVGNFFYGLNRFKEAEDYYTRCLNQVTAPEERAGVLNNLGNIQRDLNEYAQAEVSYTEALQIQKGLAVTNPQAYLPDVAMTLNNLGNLQCNTNDYPQAEASFTEALQIRRNLAAKTPQAYLPDVAQTLNNLGLLQTNKNNYPQAEASYTEALQIDRELAATNLQAYLPGVATDLNNLGNLYWNTHDYAQAEASFTEALQIRRSLARMNPQAYLPKVAGVLNNLGVLYRNTNNYPQAEASYTEALQVQRELAAKNPQAYLPDVAQILNNLSALQADNHNYSQAEASLTEALQIRRDLARKNPQAYLPDVVMTLVNLSIFYQAYTPNEKKSLQYTKEAIETLDWCNDTPWVQTMRKAVHQVIVDWKGKN